MSLKFASRYLTVIFGTMVITGIVLVFLPALTDVFGTVYYDMYAGEGAYESLSSGEREFNLFVFGVLGSVMASWALILAYISAVHLRNGERWAWNLILAGTLTWFVLDTYISATTGNWLNVGINVALLVLVEIGLGLSYSKFYGKNAPVNIVTSTA